MSDCQSIELFVWAYAYREIDYLKIHFPCNLHKIKAIRNRTEICENIFIFSYLAARCVALLLIFHFLSKLITFISFSPECNFFSICIQILSTHWNSTWNFESEWSFVIHYHLSEFKFTVRVKVWSSWPGPMSTTTNNNLKRNFRNKLSAENWTKPNKTKLQIWREN